MFDAAARPNSRVCLNTDKYFLLIPWNPARLSVNMDLITSLSAS